MTAIRVFLSHTWLDKPFAIKVVAAMRELVPSIDVWHDCERLLVGQSIDSEVEDAIDQSWLVALLWSANSATSQGVQHELTYSAATGKRIVPVTIDVAGNVLPPLLPEVGQNPLWLPLGDAPTDERIELVAAGLIVAAIEHLAVDPEMGLPGSDDLLRQIRSLGTTLVYVLGRTDEPSIKSQSDHWKDAFRSLLGALDAHAEVHLDHLETSQQLLTEVVGEVSVRPTNRQRLLVLRAAAEAMRSTDPSGCDQAVKVIDLRLDDPLV